VVAEMEQVRSNDEAAMMARTPRLDERALPTPPDETPRVPPIEVPDVPEIVPQPVPEIPPPIETPHPPPQEVPEPGELG
jgi:hypothetical protein